MTDMSTDADYRERLAQRKDPPEQLGLKAESNLRRVNHKGNSECSSARLEDLDWEKEWWTDSWDGKGITHIKVPHKGHDGMEGTVHRVYPRHATHSRIHYKDGELYWIVDEKQPETAPERPRTRNHG